MDKLHALISSRIRALGRITFMEFMDAALYEPGLGYYASERAPIGGAGDYYTSPHAHPVFGALVGRQIAECWEAMGGPSPFNVIEMGGGEGYLAKDLLDYLRTKPVGQAIVYTLVERNQHFEARQRARLADHGCVRWTASLDGIEQGIRGVLLSNELIDAFPVHVVETASEGLREVYVTLDGERFAETLGPPSTPELEAYLNEFAPLLPPGYRTEVNLLAKGWMKQAASLISEGFLLTIDYGYPAAEYFDEERSTGTLMSYQGHTAGERFYDDVGDCDITAHVNFSALRKWGEKEGFRPLGYTRQGPWLVALGLDEVVAEWMAARTASAREMAMVHNLIMPSAIGDTLKVLLLYKGGANPSPRGFSIRNELSKL